MGADVRNCALHAQPCHANATMLVGQEAASMTRPTRRANPSHSLASARQEKNQCTRLARSAHHAGLRRTKHATASRQSAFAILQRSSLRPAHAPRFALIAPIHRANVMKDAGQAKALTRRVIIRASALPSLASAKREKSLSIRLARSARLAGQRRTKRATVSQQLASASLQRNYLRPARALRCVLDAPSPLANAQQKHAGLAKASTQRETTRAIVSLSWASVTKEKSPYTRLGKSARLAGRRRTRHACASQHSAFATRRGAILWSDHGMSPFLSAVPPTFSG